MATNRNGVQTKAMKAAAEKRFEALMDARAEEFAKKIKGHYRLIQPTPNVPMQVLSEEFAKSRRRKLN